MEMHLRSSKSRVPAASLGEDLSIRFVNTVAWRLRDPAEDRLASGMALLDWFGEAGLADKVLTANLRKRWLEHPREERAFRKNAVKFREAVYRLFVSRMKSGKFDPAALDILNGVLGSRTAELRIAPSRGTLLWQPGNKPAAAGDLLKPIAWSAAELLMGPRANKLRQCQDERGCGWLFVDESRAQNRRWCSMGDCGNRAKALRHYRRNAS
jgi:predicted RNA-binding Zn ribbon-like protein